jgi:hypothetical protein
VTVEQSQVISVASRRWVRQDGVSTNLRFLAEHHPARPFGSSQDAAFARRRAPIIFFARSQLGITSFAFRQSTTRPALLVPSQECDKRRACAGTDTLRFVTPFTAPRFAVRLNGLGRGMLRLPLYLPAIVHFQIVIGEQ